MRTLVSILIIGGVMSFQLIGAGSDLSSTQTQMNKNILELKNNETTTVFKDDSGTRRVLLGKGADGFYGVKVSQEGNDVYSATNDKLIFNSSQNIFKIVDSGTTTVDATGASSAFTANVAHSLSEPPLLIATVVTPVSPGVYHNTPWFIPDPLSTTGMYLSVTSWSQDTQVNFQVETGSTFGGSYIGTYTFKYYILQETAN